MPTKVTERDVCRKIIDRNEEELTALRDRGKQFMPYNKASFRSDMRSSSFLATTAVIDAKWDMLRADEIVVGNESRYAVDIARLYLVAGVRLPMPTGRVIDRLIDRETDAEEGGQ